MKAIQLVLILVISMFATSVRAAEFGCMGGGVLSGGIGYGIGNMIHPNAGKALAVIGAVIGCKGGSKLEDGTYGQQPVAQPAPAPQEPTLAIDGTEYYGSNPGVTAAAARAIARDAKRQQKMLEKVTECKVERWEPSSCQRLLRQMGYRVEKIRVASHSGSGHAYIEPQDLGFLD